MKVLIVDDEQPARDRLRQLVDDFGEHEIVGEATNGEQAVALAASLEPDVVLLDIRMPGVDGIETAHHLNSMATPPAVVFTTAYNEYAIDAFEARAIGYVLKPVRAHRLESALEHASKLAPGTLNEVAKASKLENRRRHLCVRSHGRLKLIPVPDIYYFRADQKWPEYLEFCDRFYFAVPQDFPQEVLPADHGLMVADAYGAAILRPSIELTLAGARRRSMTLRFAQTAAGRLHGLTDPGFAAG